METVTPPPGVTITSTSRSTPSMVTRYFIARETIRSRARGKGARGIDERT